MDQKAISYFYDQWVETDGYLKESAVENPTKKYTEEIKNIIGEDLYRKISDKVLEFACEVEETAFSHGFRYGVAFMSSILNGGMMNEQRNTNF